MSIEKSRIVDVIHIDSQTGEVVLTIMDHLDWTDSNGGHLFLLQEADSTLKCNDVLM